MKKFLFLLLVVGMSMPTWAQKPAPSIPFYIVKDEGDQTTMDVQPGDKLVYAVDAGGQQYDFVVTYRSYTAKGIQFDYAMSAPANKKGSVRISEKGCNSSRKYVNYFGGGEMVLEDACTVWLCYDNFMDMPMRETKMQLDDNAEETFYRPEKDEVRPVVDFKGSKVKLDGFILRNAKDESATRTLWVMNSSANPIILHMDLGWKITLKAIRKG